ncbi:MAG: elongation factor 1-beta [Euryarchaeota archaeon]|nr:elongation factor 1-beta [Euryarchaeota archaeon]
MGDVLITYKIMPDGVDVDLERIKSDVEKKLEGIAQINDFNEEPVAFGLKALIVRVIVKDEGGISDKIEEILQGIDNVQGVVVNEVTLI